MIDADRYWNEKETELQRSPKCSCCKEPITSEDCVEIDGDLFCNECESNNALSFWFDFCREHYKVSTKEMERYLNE